MDGPTFDSIDHAWPRLRLSFVAMTAPPSIWVHGFSAENDNAARGAADAHRAASGLLVIPRLPPARP